MSIYIIERTWDRATRFFIQAAPEGEPKSVTKEVFCEGLARVCDDIEQQNHMEAEHEDRPQDH